MNLENKLFKNALIYIIGGILAHSISYLLMPVLTRYLSPADYGIVYVFNSIMFFFIPVVGLQTDTYFARHYFEFKKDAFAEHVGGIFKVILFALIIVLSFVYVFRNQVSSSFAVSKNVIFICVFVSVATVVGTLVLRYYQMENKANNYMFIIIITTLLNLILSLLLVVYFKLGWKGRIIGIAISVFLQAIVSIIILYKKGVVKFKLNYNHTKEIIFFGFPLLIGAMSGWVVNLVDKLFITKMVSISATGIYGIGASMGMIMGLLSDSFCRAWVPYFFKNIGENSNEKNIKIVKLTYLFIGAVIFASFAVALFSYIFIKYFIAKEYFQSYKYVIWISLGQGIAGINSIFVYYLLYEKKNFLISGIALTSAVINLILNYVLIKTFGTIGAAYTIFFTFLTGAIITISFSARYHKMPWLFFLDRNILTGEKNDRI